MEPAHMNTTTPWKVDEAMESIIRVGDGAAAQGLGSNASANAALIVSRVNGYAALVAERDGLREACVGALSAAASLSVRSNKDMERKRRIVDAMVAALEPSP